MFDRMLDARIRRRLTAFPAVALFGSRQCGKTTLARQLLPDAPYFDLEQESDRVRLDASWDDLLATPGPLVLDEAQAHPPLFPRLRGAIDEDRRRMGRFLLLGSVSPVLAEQVSESLAGRIATVELGPLTWGEVSGAGLELDDLWLRGGFPDALMAPTTEDWREWCRSYLDLMLHRDLLELGIEIKPPVLRRLLSMLAHSHGGWWNVSRLASSLGVSRPTVDRYASILEQAFLVRFLHPWSSNLGKRLRKRPKVFIRDSGLVHALLGLSDGEGLFGHPGAGLSWEGFVIEQLLRREEAAASAAQPWCFATSDGYEADLLLEQAGRLLPIEVKLTARPDQRDVGRFIKTVELLGANRGLLVCRAREPWSAGPVDVVPVWDLLEGRPTPLLG
jgi:hypothetical protein